MSRIKDKIGDRYGRLIVIEFVGQDKDGCALWKCLCDCGNISVVKSTSLNKTGTKSCGCLRTDRIRAVVALAPGEAAFRAFYKKYHYDASRRQLIFSLSQDQFRSITSSPCYYCGQVPQKEFQPRHAGNNGVYIYNGIDRINNDIGYTIENCVPCCWDCNYLKRGLDHNDFLERIKRIAEHLLWQDSSLVPMELIPLLENIGAQ